ncbi:hypothetical protein C8A03DRAFT_31780 [Achaetomium macrosporum]|uniref:RING-type domain-containing protein n=1 Tax=Achaetomium macrosporum TaxID=79813 RepID=A0AAN7HDU7_9PEZI|nr:hypothetical protein C8A03DRAFT_31780 [Achaetomium macrosporum]
MDGVNPDITFVDGDFNLVGSNSNHAAAHPSHHHQHLGGGGSLPTPHQQKEEGTAADADDEVSGWQTDDDGPLSERAAVIALDQSGVDEMAAGVVLICGHMLCQPCWDRYEELHNDRHLANDNDPAMAPMRCPCCRFELWHETCECLHYPPVMPVHPEDPGAPAAYRAKWARADRQPYRYSEDLWATRYPATFAEGAEIDGICERWYLDFLEIAWKKGQVDGTLLDVWTGEMEGWMDENFVKNVFQTICGENVQVKVIRDT